MLPGRPVYRHECRLVSVECRVWGDEDRNTQSARIECGKLAVVLPRKHSHFLGGSSRRPRLNARNCPLLSGPNIALEAKATWRHCSVQHPKLNGSCMILIDLNAGDILFGAIPGCVQVLFLALCSFMCWGLPHAKHVLSH